MPPSVTSPVTPIVRADGPVLIFGGPYSNLQATEAVLSEARRLGVPTERIICTGDLTAYCGDPVATIDLVKDSGIHVVMGNCDLQLAEAADSCGCGFPSDSLCERLSSAWFTYANSRVRADQRAWLAELPRRIDLDVAGKRLAVIHGSISVINQFIYATTPMALKREEIMLSDCDGVIGGHCGLPFTQIIDGQLWHNAGVVGMPANDGTPRVWLSLLTPISAGLKIEHRAISYDNAAAASRMQQVGLPDEYSAALASGIWPSCDVLPRHETNKQGTEIESGTVAWMFEDTRANGAIAVVADTKLLWPSLLIGSV